MGLKKLLEELRGDASFNENITDWTVIPPREGQWEDIPGDLHPELAAALAARGIRRLYSHQAECRRFIRAGRDTVVVTPTASGKTLCYNLSVIEGLLKNPASRALYLFPTKALSQDQQAALNEIVFSDTPALPVSTFDERIFLGFT